MTCLRKPACALAALVFLLSATARAGEPAEEKEPIPYARIAKDVTGDVVASTAIATGVPVLVGAGYVYKGVDIVHDVGKAAIDKQNKWLDAEIIVADKDSEALEKLVDAGGDVTGDEARKLRARLLDHTMKLNSGDDPDIVCAFHALVNNLGYAVEKVAFEKVAEKVFSKAFEAIGFSKLIERILPAPEGARWLIKKNGPFRKFKYEQLGWNKLGTKARLAEKTVAEIMNDLEGKAAAKMLAEGRAEDVHKLADAALEGIFDKVMADNPSQTVQVRVTDFRLVAAREAAWAPAPAVAVAVPVMTAVAAAPVAVAAPAAAAFAPDPVVRAIRSDDSWQVDRSDRTVEHSSPAPEPVQEAAPQQDPRDAARWQELHEELMRVGDGKTFAVCSDGCPGSSDSSWDGNKGGLYDK